MSAGSAAKLYTAEILGLATQLTHYPLSDDLPDRVDVRSRTCGSSLTLAVESDENGALQRLGMQVSACAIGQAAAAIFAGDAQGRTQSDMVRALMALEGWLAGQGKAPAWRGIEALEPARAHSARHGAIVLAWKAGTEALSKGNHTR